MWRERCRLITALTARLTCSEGSAEWLAKYKLADFGSRVHGRLYYTRTKSSFPCHLWLNYLESCFSCGFKQTDGTQFIPSKKATVQWKCSHIHLTRKTLCNSILVQQVVVFAQQQWFAGQSEASYKQEIEHPVWRLQCTHTAADSDFLQTLIEVTLYSRSHAFMQWQEEDLHCGFAIFTFLPKLRRREEMVSVNLFLFSRCGLLALLILAVEDHGLVFSSGRALSSNDYTPIEHHNIWVIYT